MVETVVVGKTALMSRPNQTERPMVLASGSRYRATVLKDVGIDVEIDAPSVDERAHDHLFDPAAPHELALALARLKAADVAPRHRDSLVIGGDQLGVLGHGEQTTVLHQCPDHTSAVEQLMLMSGQTHRLVNGLIIFDSTSGASVEGVDVVKVTMRAFDRAGAESYVERFRPFDVCGSYRLEDDRVMEPDERLLNGIEAEDLSGVLGMPIPLLRRLLVELDSLCSRI